MSGLVHSTLCLQWAGDNGRFAYPSHITQFTKLELPAIQDLKYVFVLVRNGGRC